MWTVEQMGEGRSERDREGAVEHDRAGTEASLYSPGVDHTAVTRLLTEGAEGEAVVRASV